MSSSISVPGLPETLATSTSMRVPSVKWAQRRDRLLLTIEAPQGVSPTLSLQEGTDNTLVYSCTASSEDSSSYALSLELFGSINASETRMQIQKSGAMLVVIAMKLTAGPHWPRLLKAPGASLVGRYRIIIKQQQNHSHLSPPTSVTTLLKQKQNEYRQGAGAHQGGL
mmetsp:Transcript_5878/g.15290  ORF Transcript_5878/g.15290 Transcript_5878/m.15290 type:complete len:168 (-) Transcript_5878:234-737(-)